MWQDKDFLTFDFETSGEPTEHALQSWRFKSGKSWLTSLVWFCPDLNPRKGEEPIRGGLYPTKQDISEMLTFALDTKRRMVGWNTQFDAQWLIAAGFEKEVMHLKWLDGMLLWRHWFIEPEYEIITKARKSYGLKKAVEEFLPQHAGYEEFVDFHNTSAEARKALHEYNIQDVIFTAKLTKKFYNLLSKNPQQLKAALIEADCIPLVARANHHGMCVDYLATRELEATLTDKADFLGMKLAPVGVTEKVIRSPKQLRELLFEKWKLQPMKLSSAGHNSTDKEVLHELALVDPRAKDLKEYREALNNRTKFATNIRLSADYNENFKTHPQAIIFGTYSGRFTYGSKQGAGKNERPVGFALHQSKKGKEFRRVIVAPEGYDILEFDAAGQEFRWMAIASGDETMLHLCRPGEDPHSFMGAAIAHKDYHEMVKALKENGDHEIFKPLRQMGKIGNLSLQYRTSARKLRMVARVQYGIPMEQVEADHIHRTYQRTYPKVPIYWNVQINKTRRSGYVETFAGRRVEVSGNWEGRNGWSMGSTAINYRIQGTGADQKYLALSVLRPYLTQNDIHFAWDLHDGIYLYVPKHKTKQAAHMIRDVLANLPYKRAWDFEPPIPLPWDCKVGPSWGDLKEFKFEE